MFTACGEQDEEREEVLHESEGWGVAARSLIAAFAAGAEFGQDGFGGAESSKGGLQ